MIRKKKFKIHATGKLFALPVFITLAIFYAWHLTFAATPNPGHPWSEVGDGIFVVSGPTVSRTYTFPDASTTVLTTNSLVTVAQGGTGLGTLTLSNVILGNGTDTPSFVAPGTIGDTLISNGNTWVSSAPSAKIIISARTTASLTADSRCHPSSGYCVATSNATSGMHIGWNMVIRNLRAYMTTAPASGSSCEFSVYEATACSGSFSAAGLACTITGNGSAVSCENTSSSVSLVSGDCIQMFFNETGTCTGVNSWTFEGIQDMRSICKS